MYHLPRGKTWDAQRMVDALQKRGLKATRDADCVTVTLPVERIDIDRIANAKTVDDLRSEIVDFTSAKISFVPTAVLQNIVFECAFNYQANCFPLMTDVTNAIVDCGYDTGDERELAQRYYIGEIDLNPIFDRIEELQIEKGNAIAENRFDDAKAILDKQRPLKQQIEDLLRASL